MLGFVLSWPLPAQSLLVKDIWPGPVDASIDQLTDVNGTLFFGANDGAHGHELWKSDGTAAGTVMVKDMNRGPGSTLLNWFTNVNGTLFFTAEDQSTGESPTYSAELWKSDGTAAGTVMVKDIYPGSQGSRPAGLINVNGTLFFAALNETSGFELWKSDGTEEGTVLVKDISPGPLGAFDDPAVYSITFLNVNGVLFFTPRINLSGPELWKSDGTSAGTVMVKDIFLGSEGSGPTAYSLINVNGTIFFTIRDPGSFLNDILWKSDGTGAGTVMVKDIHRGIGSTLLGAFINLNGTLFFTVENEASGKELWKSDGTAAGTVMVKDIYPGSQSSRPSGLINVNGTLFFGANDEAHGQELWKSDGTAAGTVMVKDINPGSGNSDPLYFSKININGTLFFTATNGTNGSELWKSDGTGAGTVMVGDIHPGAGSSTPGYSDPYWRNIIAHLNGTLFFTAADGVHGQELWKYTPDEEPVPKAFRINAGGEAYAGQEGQAFIADQYANAGSRSVAVTAGIAGTEDDALYRQGRYGERFTYSLPTGDGVYYVVLHFAETYWGNLVQGGAGSRRFNVDIEEFRKLTDYDIYAKAGGSLKAIQEAFRVVVKDSLLEIRFSKGTADLPLISAIEVFEEDAFRINAAGSAYLSSNGWFLSDFYGSGGSASAYAPGAVAGSEDDELYRSNRHGSLFHYNLPTGPGQFQVTLHFNETYWGNLAQGGAGSRRFNVSAEGERKLSGYDTYQRAGGAMRARQEQFSVIVTDQVLSLAFLRGSADNSVDFAHVAAIEVVKVATPAARLSRQGDQTPESLATALYPNPVHTTLTVRLSFPIREIKATAIRDAIGSRLLVNTHKPIGEQQFQVDVSSLPKGGYLLQVQTGQGEQVLKFVKQ